MYLLNTLRRTVALGALGLTMLVPPVPSYSAEVEQRTRSPQLANQTQIKAQLREYLDRSATMRLADRVRNAGVEGRWVDLTWQLNRLAQAGQELPDLSELGLVKQENSSYIIDLAKNPEWEPWTLKPSLLQNPDVFLLHAQRLRERGFREQDIQTLKQYVTQNDSRRVVLDAERSVVRSVAGHRSRSLHAQQTIEAADAASYVYQLERARAEAEKQWAAGLLERLDPQRQRILMSFYQELGGMIAFLPDAHFDQTIAIVAEQLVSGMYEQQLIQREQGLSQ